MNKKLKVGVLGIRRGASFAKQFEANPHTKLSAICDFDEERVKEFIHGRKGIAVYSNYDRFLEHDLDIVIICGYCLEHAPQAVKALEAGKHVLSEVIACKTLSEGVALCRAVEKANKIYMLGENYSYFTYIQEMQRLYKRGTIGEYRYGEGEYVHDCRDQYHTLTDGPEHWRNWIPATYYSTHSLGPIITITGTRAVKVNGFVVPNLLSGKVGRCGDDWGLLICTMDNDALTRVIPWSTGPHDSIWYRLHGTKGAMENNRWRDTQTLNLFIQKAGEKSSQKSYTPRFRKYAQAAEKAGHGGADFFIVKDFVKAIIKNEPAPIDVYKAMDMTLPGILGYRSAWQDNISLDVPDFRKEEIRKRYENDHWSPDPKDKNIPGQPAPSILGEIKIPDSVYKIMEKKRKKALLKEYEKAIKI